MAIRENMPGLARPVRMVDRSSRATDTAFSIFSSASKRASSIICAVPLPHGSLYFSRICSPQVVTSVPIFSPATARAILPSVSRLNTRIGMPLSMHRLNAVASATRSRGR